MSKESCETLLEQVSEPVRQLWGAQKLRITRLGGDASTRIYHRIHSAEGPDRTLIVMQLGPDPLKSDEIAGAERPAELPFYQVQRFLADGGIDVPEVYAYLRDDGLLLLEDLGDATLESVVVATDDSTRWPLYRRAIDMLVQMQRHAEAASQQCICFQRRFDHQLLRWELDHFREWLLEADRGAKLADDEQRTLDTIFDRLAQQLVDLPTTWVHRDYQSRNLMCASSCKTCMWSLPCAWIKTGTSYRLRS